MVTDWRKKFEQFWYEGFEDIFISYTHKDVADWIEKNVLPLYESPASPAAQETENSDLLEWMVMFYGALNELVRLKDNKDREGKTPDYEERQPKAWHFAKEAIKLWNEKSDYGAKLEVIRKSTPVQPLAQDGYDGNGWVAHFTDEQSFIDFLKWQKGEGKDFQLLWEWSLKILKALTELVRLKNLKEDSKLGRPSSSEALLEHENKKEAAWTEARKIVVDFGNSYKQLLGNLQPGTVKGIKNK